MGAEASFKGLIKEPIKFGKNGESAIVVFLCLRCGVVETVGEKNK